MKNGKKKYPATLVTTADHDDRVVPGHSFKFAAAALQEMQAGDAPVLIRIETRAGHGAGKPTAKMIEETADQYAFLVKNLGMKTAVIEWGRLAAALVLSFRETINRGRRQYISA